jgi:hypothetical protein
VNRRVTILILHEYFKTHAKIQTNWRWFRRCCKSPKLRKNKWPFAKNCSKEIECLLKMIKVNFEITAWEWYTLQTACNDRQIENSEFFWVTSTLSGKLISRRICPRMIATEIVFIQYYAIGHSPCKYSATLSRKWFFRYNLLI